MEVSIEVEANATVHHLQTLVKSEFQIPHPIHMIYLVKQGTKLAPKQQLDIVDQDITVTVEQL